MDQEQFNEKISDYAVRIGSFSESHLEVSAGLKQNVEEIVKIIKIHDKNFNALAKAVDQLITIIGVLAGFVMVLIMDFIAKNFDILVSFSSLLGKIVVFLAVPATIYGTYIAHKTYNLQKISK